MMTRNGFERLARIHGADLSRWPSRERSEATALLRARPDLLALLDEEALTDRALRLIARPVSDARADRVATVVLDRLARPPAMPPPAVYWQRPRALWSAALFLAGVALAGIWTGDAGMAAYSEGGLSSLVSSDVMLISWEQ